MLVEVRRNTDFSTQRHMDFSRNSQGFNASDETNATVTDQELIRRLAASRSTAGLNMPQEAGLSMSQNASSYGLVPGGAQGGMLAPGVNTNQFAGTPPAGMPMMQHHNDREDELLLQLLLARRRRQELRHEFQEPDRRQQGAFADELLRLRQAGNATSAASAAATAASMFGSDQDVQQFQQVVQQHQHPRGFPSMLSQVGALNLPVGNAAALMRMPEQSNAVAGNFRSPPFGSNSSFASGRRFDDYLLRTQQQPQESILAGLSGEQQQRIELSPARLFALQQQQASGFFDPSSLKRAFGEDVFKSTGDLEKVDGAQPPMKKKRIHKKKPSDMPRRPLSAYNLFFSEERERILKEIDNKEGATDEGKDDSKQAEASETKKPQALLRPMLPSEKKRRPHRKTHGKISFRLLAQMVGQRWKSLSAERRKYYQDLAKEDMARQKKAMEEYYLKQSGKGKKTDSDANEAQQPSIDEPGTTSKSDASGALGASQGQQGT